ncbi:MAG: efflux RND transporter periplasmic adaptor subunit [Acidobacteria bacterium]|nr:efflux RND transporter periplasmic adaptor subunit [Acidobacteriota bacterium]
MKFSREFLAVSLLVIAAAFLVWMVKRGVAFAATHEEASSETQADEKRNESSGTAILVEAAAVQRGDLIQRVSAQGRVHGYQQLDLKNEVGGRLLKLHVHDGQVVKQGDLIAEIDDREYALALSEASAAMLAAKAEYLTYDPNSGPPEQSERPLSDQLAELERKREQGELSQEAYRQQKFMLELEDLKTGSRREDVIAARTLKQAKTAEQRAQLNLEKCRIIAPFDGTVFNVEVTEGQFLGAQTVLVKLVNLNDLAIKAKILESEVGAVEPGRSVEINFAALPELGAVAGKVDAVSPYVNVEDKTVDAVIRFTNPGGVVKPGMFADVIIDSRVYKDRLMVPKTAILPRDNRLVVFKINEQSRAQWIYVKTGVDNDSVVEITEGELEEGDMVLTNNHFTMGHDTLVKVDQ